MQATALTERMVDRDTLRACIEAQACPWCGREGLSSLANHTVTAHGIYAAELRELAELPPKAPLCAGGLSDVHRDLARGQDTHQWLQRPAVLLAAAATREASYDEEQRRRRVRQLNAARPKAVEAARRWLEAEKRDAALAAERKLARSQARRAFRAGAECPICGCWFCSAVPPGRDYRQLRYCSEACRREGRRRVRSREWMRRRLADVLAHETATGATG